MSLQEIKAQFQSDLKRYLETDETIIGWEKTLITFSCSFFTALLSPDQSKRALYRPLTGRDFDEPSAPSATSPNPTITGLIKTMCDHFQTGNTLYKVLCYPSLVMAINHYFDRRYPMSFASAEDIIEILTDGESYSDDILSLIKDLPDDVFTRNLTDLRMLFQTHIDSINRIGALPIVDG